MKLITFLFLAAFICSETFSKDTKSTVGLEFSPTLRSLYGVSSHLEDMTMGFSTGFSFQYYIKKRFSLLSGICYERKGAMTSMIVRNQDGVLLGSSMYRRDYNYLVLSVLGSIGNKKDRFYLESGPFLAYLISRWDRTNSVVDVNGWEKNTTNNSHRLDFGWIIGAGYKLKISSKINLDSGIRENLGLIDTSKGDMFIKTNSIAFSVALKYKIN